MFERQVILFGGTFDPIHLGHTTVTSFAAEELGAQKTIFIPAKQSPLKKISPHASDDDRLAMIELAIAENENFEVSDYELKKTGPNYTVDTVRKFQQNLGNQTAVYWLLGADTVEELAMWYKITELIDACFLCVMYRAGFARPDFTAFENLWGQERVAKLRDNIIQTPLVDISSTEVRRTLAGGGTCEMLAAPVAQYIAEHGLYR